jgi:hypothetical protein
MTDQEDRLRRVGENEALYRLVNEQIEALSAGVTASGKEFGVICECAALDCKTQIMIKPTVYEQARATRITSSSLAGTKSTRSRRSLRTMAASF